VRVRPRTRGPPGCRRVAASDFRVRHVGGNVVENHGNHRSCATNARLSVTDCGVNGDAVPPIERTSFYPRFHHRNASQGIAWPDKSPCCTCGPSAHGSGPKRYGSEEETEFREWIERVVPEHAPDIAALGLSGTGGHRRWRAQGTDFKGKTAEAPGAHFAAHRPGRLVNSLLDAVNPTFALR
jgi:hypothetical protein